MESAAINRRAFCGTLGALALQCEWAGPVLAQQAFPAKPIRLIVPFARGTEPDLLARRLAQRFADGAHWTIAIENEPGAHGNLGLESVARAVPDGYTLGLGHTSNLTVNPALFATAPIDPLLDVAPVSHVSSQAQVLMVANGSRYASLGDLVASARARPGALRMGSPGQATMGHLAGELLQQRASIRCTHVPGKALAPALGDLAAKRIDFCLSDLRTASAFIDAGHLRAVAVTSTRRLASKPDLPAIAETYAGFDATTWTGIVAPARLSKERIFQINAQVQRALDRKDLQDQLATEGIAGVGGPPQYFAEYLRAEHIKWGALIRQSAIPNRLRRKQ